MLFYDLDNKKKELMYAELLERRNRISVAASSGDAEALEYAAKEQMNVDKT